MLSFRHSSDSMPIAASAAPTIRAAIGSMLAQPSARKNPTGAINSGIANATSATK
jgi:hypothetical protein